MGCASRGDAHGARARTVGTRERIARHQHAIQCVLRTIVFSLLMSSKYSISARKLFCCCLVPRVGVAMVKSSTSYFWFLVTFLHNRICGLAVAFKNYFVGCLPTLLKIIPKTGDVGELRPSANSAIRPPPPPPPSARNDSPCIYSLVVNQAMQSHGR